MARKAKVAGSEMTRLNRAPAPTARRMGNENSDKIGVLKVPPPMPSAAARAPTSAGGSWADGPLSGGDEDAGLGGSHCQGHDELIGHSGGGKDFQQHRDRDNAAAHAQQTGEQANDDARGEQGHPDHRRIDRQQIGHARSRRRLLRGRDGASKLGPM